MRSYSKSHEVTQKDHELHITLSKNFMSFEGYNDVDWNSLSDNFKAIKSYIFSLSDRAVS